MLHTREKGNVGEDIACKFLVKNGFNVIDRNYYKKWGELDVVAKRGNELHFFEVKISPLVISMTQRKMFIYLKLIN